MIGGLQGENRDLNNKYLKKNLTELVANIWDHTGGFHKLKHYLWKFLKLKVSILQVGLWFRKLNLWFRSLLNCLSTWCGCFPMAIISSFQLRFAHRLKHWTPDFPSFKTIYCMYKMDSRKFLEMCPIVALLLNFFMSDSSLCFSSLHSWFALAKDYEASKLSFFM